MLKQETLDYIIEKMRGDSLTPLGTGKNDTKALSFRLIDALNRNDLNEGSSIFNKIVECIGLGKSLLMGSWKLSSALTGLTDNTYELSCLPEDSKGNTSSIVYVIDVYFRKGSTRSPHFSKNAPKPLITVGLRCTSYDGVDEFDEVLLETVIDSKPSYTAAVKREVNASVDFIEGIIGNSYDTSMLRKSMLK